MASIYDQIKATRPRINPVKRMVNDLDPLGNIIDPEMSQDSNTIGGGGIGGISGLSSVIGGAVGGGALSTIYGANSMTPVVVNTTANKVSNAGGATGFVSPGVAVTPTAPIAPIITPTTVPAETTTEQPQLWTDYQNNLRQAQREAELARRQADEAAFLRQRQINQALLGRGLAGSGLQQLTQAQGQLQLSQQLNQQAASDAATRAGLYQQYQQLQAAEVAQNQSSFEKIMNTALAMGDTSSENLQKIAGGYGVTLSDEQLTTAQTLGGGITTSDSITNDILALSRKWEPTTSAVTRTGAGEVMIDGVLHKFNTLEEASSIYKSVLTNRGIPMDQIEVIAEKSPLTSKLEYKYVIDGKTFGKLVDALNYIKQVK